jgi:hypothetical protein
MVNNEIVEVGVSDYSFINSSRLRYDNTNMFELELAKSEYRVLRLRKSSKLPGYHITVRNNFIVKHIDNDNILVYGKVIGNCIQEIETSDYEFLDAYNLQYKNIDESESIKIKNLYNK